MNFLNLEIQLKDIESEIRNKLLDLLSGLRYFKFVTAIVLESGDKTKYGTLYSNSKSETIIIESNIDDVFESIYTTIMSNI